MKEKSEKIIEFRAVHPDWTLRQIAEVAECSRQYVDQTLRSRGLPTRAVGAAPRKGRGGSNLVNRFGDQVIITTHAAGAVGELQVACDLLRRGMNVYKAMHMHSACDLIALIDRVRPVRIEVRSGKLRSDGSIATNAPAPDNQNLFDVFAIALPDGSVRYKPDIADW